MMLSQTTRCWRMLDNVEVADVVVEELQVEEVEVL